MELGLAVAGPLKPDTYLAYVWDTRSSLVLNEELRDASI
jgi:hypothetical protein